MPIIELVKDFFEEVFPFNKSPHQLIPGQIAWVPTLIPKPLPLVIDAERKNPRDHDSIKYKIRGMLSSDFRKKDRLPIHRLKLQPTEELLAIKGKKRPCIMITQYMTELNESDIEKITRGKRYLLQQEQIFLPIYSTQEETSPSGFPKEFVKEIRKLSYPHLLYFPPTFNYKKRNNFNDSIKEGIIRLDRIFSSIPHHSKVSVTNIKLSDEYMAILLEHIKGYFLNERSENLEILKELCQSAEG